MAFLAHRPMLLGLAYRLLGSLHDAEDVLQEAYLRWSGVDRQAGVAPRRFLTTVVTRLALDRLRARRAQRETYVGQWLPEPVATDGSPFGAVDTSDLSLAVLHLMEQLSPPQRAVYVLRTAFELPYEQIARIVDRTPQDCRQLGARADRVMRAARPRFAPDPAEHQRLLAAFVSAAREGDLAQLGRLLHEQVVAYGDGGGRVRAARNPITTRTKVARFFAGIYSRPSFLRCTTVQLNGAPALVVANPNGRHVLAARVDARLITNIYLIANPDKLARVTTPAPSGGSWWDPL